MVETQLRARGICDERVLAVMGRIPRHEFVPEHFRTQAYNDNPLPIGSGQTISQPYIVALMLEALRLRSEDVVLEIGSGSGYQTALLAELAARVYSIERHPELVRAAAAVLSRLGYRNVMLFKGDGSAGLPAFAPYDGIIVAAAAPDIPRALFDQLKEGGRLLVPIGAADAQELMLVQKQQGQPAVTALTGCRFVPLIGEEGYSQ
jgi:protein-L-isoaspartate(D-aspartate) O-methyltransferase